MAVKKIQCADSHCDAIIAHQISDKTFELRRTDQMVTMTGMNWSSIATCPKNPAHQTSIVVSDGKVDATLLRYKEEGGEGGDQGEDESHDQ